MTQFVTKKVYVKYGYYYYEGVLLIKKMVYIKYQQGVNQHPDLMENAIVEQIEKNVHDSKKLEKIVQITREKN